MDLRQRERPAYGTEKVVLYPPTPGQRVQHELVRMIYADVGDTTFYDEDSKHFVTWPGSWQRVERLGWFDSQDEARDFMLKLRAL